MKASRVVYEGAKIPFKVTPKAARKALGGRDVPKLMGPLELYRAILRAHRAMPAFQRELGDKYVRQEFRLHKQVDNPVQIIGFLTEWQRYLDFARGGDEQWRGYRMDDATLEKLTDDQVHQLHGLMQETRGLYKGE